MLIEKYSHSINKSQANTFQSYCFPTYKYSTIIKQLYIISYPQYLYFNYAIEHRLFIYSTQRMQQFKTNYTMRGYHLIPLLVLIMCQLADTVRIQSRKYSLLGQEEQIQITAQGTELDINFDQAFQTEPEVGLSIYNFELSYNPNFAIRIPGIISATGFKAEVTGQQSLSRTFSNQLYIMYIASDFFQSFAIYRIEELSKFSIYSDTTAELGSPNQRSKQARYSYNFKSINDSSFFQVQDKNNDQIRLLVFLTGLRGESQLASNGYPNNRAYFFIQTNVTSYLGYDILVRIQDISGDIIIKNLDLTVIYFQPERVFSAYQMNAGIVDVVNFGGTRSKTELNRPLDSLQYNPVYEKDMKFFFGVTRIVCQQGQSINLLAVERFNYNSDGRLQNLVLTFETQKSTYINDGSFSYIQYKVNCSMAEGLCEIDCNLQSVFQLDDGSCEACLYSCRDCDDAKGCRNCPETRVKNNVTQGCDCADSTYFDDFKSNECIKCFDQNSLCKSCSRKGFCTDCYEGYTFNEALRTCQCAPGRFRIPTSIQSTSIIAKIQGTCLTCPSQCIYCTSETDCEACTVPFYLSMEARKINEKFQTCVPICDPTTYFDSNQWKCINYDGDLTLFDSNGRLSFDWDFTNVDNLLIIDILFSKSDMSFYFYENQEGYKFENSGTQGRNSDGQTGVYYDDGKGYIDGYTAGGNSFSGAGFANSFSGSGSGAAAGNSADFSGSFMASQTQNIFDQSALEGKYYGLGQARFFSEKYRNISAEKRAISAQQGRLYTATHFDEYGIPFGKHQLKQNQGKAMNRQFLEAVRNNLAFTIDGQEFPYTIKAFGADGGDRVGKFQIQVRPEKSYLKSTAAVIFKNPALVRNGQTALQTPRVEKELDRLDFYSVAQIKSAQGLRDRSGTIIQVLWGVCKYLLFIGLGWPVMPLMLIMQYIMGTNYISTQLPLNLDYFLASFQDFRNPSILFNPQRNQFDREVVNHDEIYQRVAAFEQFDRGIDFMKNSFQFFFVPLLSFGLLFLLLGINFLFNKCANRDIPIISGYLKPRIPLHVAAYTLVQALPISFFFFGQLKDTRYNHVNSPNDTYPIFNTGMAYAAFFATAIIPLIVLTMVYNYFKKRSRTGVFSLAKFKKEDHSEGNDPINLGDPIWGGYTNKPTSYGFGAYIFYLPLLVGFALAYFTKSYAWQLVGLVLGFLGLLAFAGGSSHFKDKIPKYYFAATAALMVAYGLIHASIGSNRSLSTYDQWNTGYIGIGIIFALLILAVLFSAYLLSKVIKTIYENHIKSRGCFPRLQAQKESEEDQAPERVQITGREADRKNTLMRSTVDLPPPDSEQRIIMKESPDMRYIDDETITQRENLIFLSKGMDGRATYQAENSQAVFMVAPKKSKFLANREPLTLDSQANRHVYSSGNNDLGPIKDYENESDDEDEQYMYAAGRGKESGEIRSIKIGGQQMNYDEDEDGFFVIRNSRGDIHQRMSAKKFVQTMQNSSNKVIYQGKQYEIEDGDEDFVWLTNANNPNERQRVSRNQLLAILGTRNQSSSQKKVTSILPSRKTIYSSDEEGSAAIFQKGRGATESKSQKMVYIINGDKCEVVSESKDQITFFNPNTQKTFTKSRRQIEDGRVQTYSHKTITEKVIYNLGGSNYELVGKTENGQYMFSNIENPNKKMTLSEEQYVSMTGTKEIPKLQSQKIVKRSLKQVRISDEGNYVFLDENTGEEYQIPKEMVTSVRQVYIDDEGNIWNKDEKLELEDESFEEEEQVQNNFYNNQNMIRNFQIGSQRGVGGGSSEKISQQFVNNGAMGTSNRRISGQRISQSNAYLPSSASTILDIQNDLQPNHIYNLVFFRGDHKFRDESYSYEEHDIMVRQSGVRGTNVQNVLATIKSKSPDAKVLIQDETDQQAPMMFLEGQY